jgi:hypothetical protein
LIAIGAAVAVAGCGGGEENPADSSSSDQDAARVKLEQCLRDNGADLPSESDGPGRSEVRINKEAMDACEEERKAAFGEITPEQQQEFRDAFARFASCMRDHGVDLPDPTQGDQVAVRIDGRDPAVREAQEACQDQMPEGPGPGGMAFGRQD